jgi:hypothetical protein
MSQVFAGVYDFPLNHSTTLIDDGVGRTSGHIQHQMQELSYFTNLRWPNHTPLKLSRLQPPNSTEITAHRYTLASLSKARLITFTAHFSPDQRTPRFPSRIQERNVKDWSEYWQEGGFVDLTSSPNPNATELQRRIILSQYHVRVNSAAKGQPPQESGLMNNGWYGELCFIRQLDLSSHG